MADLDKLTLGALRSSGDGKRLSVQSQPWGYVIRSGNKPPMDVLIGQVIAYFIGVCFFTAGLGLLLLPNLFASSDLGAMRLGAAALLGAGAAYLLWFASRGSQVEVHVDTAAREILEVIQNRVGKPSIISRYPFGDIGGVYLDTAAGLAPAQLVLGYRGQMILVAEGSSDELTILRTQLSRDLMGPLEMAEPRRPIPRKTRPTGPQTRAA